MNADVALAYIALGAMAKLILMRNPSPGHRYATAAGLIAGGLLCGWVSTYLPYPIRMISIAFVSIPLLFDVLGKHTGKLIDRGRIWLNERADNEQTTAKWESGQGIERRDRDVLGDCEAEDPTGRQDDAFRTFSNGRRVRKLGPAEISPANEDSATVDD